MVMGTFKPGNARAGTRPIAAITPTKVAVMAMPAAEKTRCLGFMVGPSEESIRPAQASESAVRVCGLSRSTAQHAGHGPSWRPYRPVGGSLRPDQPPFKTCPVRQERTVMLAADSSPPSSFEAPPALLVLEDGRTFHGHAFGAIGETVGEAVFATAMSGYQETLTDPSYHRQVVIATAPHIGNTGWNDEDDESGRIWVAGYVIRDAARVPSSWRSRRSLDAELRAQGVVAMCGVDTRALTRHLRDRGAMRVAVSSVETNPERLLERVRAAPRMAGAHLADEVTTSTPYVIAAAGEQRFQVVAVDLGIKSRTPFRLAERGIEVHVVPSTTTFAEIEALRPDGVFFSNGPGDPEAATSQIALLQQRDLAGSRLGITRPVREEHAVGSERLDLGEGRGGRNHVHLDPALRQPERCPRLDPKVHGNHLEALLACCRDHVGRAGRDLIGQVRACHPPRRPHPLQQAFPLGLDAGHRDAHRAPVADLAGQRPGVDATHCDDALRPQFRIQAAARSPVRRHAGRITNHVSGNPDPPGFVVLVVPPGIADVRRRRDHDLPVVTRVGQSLLVARHRRGEDRLAYRLADRAERLPVKSPAVFENQKCRRCLKG